MTLLPGRQVTGSIVAVKRLRNSVNGNGRFRVSLDTGATLTTATDAAVNYEIQNLWPALQVNPVPVTLVLDGRGSIIDAERG